MANSAGGAPKANTCNSASAQSFARTVLMIKPVVGDLLAEELEHLAVDQIADDHHVRLGAEELRQHVGNGSPSATLYVVTGTFSTS